MGDESHKLQKDPPEGSREVIEREVERTEERDKRKQRPDGDKADAQDAPDVMNASKLNSIKPVNLTLHSDGIDHWQDEPQPPDEGAREKDK